MVEKKVNITRKQLDEIAAKDGFIFKRNLNLGKRLYENSEKVLRTYNRYGEISEEYTPTNGYRFHNPIQASPPYNLGFRQFTGKGNGRKMGGHYKRKPRGKNKGLV